MSTKKIIEKLRTKDRPYPRYHTRRNMMRAQIAGMLVVRDMEAKLSSPEGMITQYDEDEMIMYATMTATAILKACDYEAYTENEKDED